MKNTIIYHNPRCSKSRQTLALLEEQGVAFEVVEYLKHPLDATTLKHLQDCLGIDNALKMMRPKEAEFKVAGLSMESNDDTLITAITQHPKLLERPIVLHNGKAIIGRPPENVLTLFS